MSTSPEGTLFRFFIICAIFFFLKVVIASSSSFVPKFSERNFVKRFLCKKSIVIPIFKNLYFLPFSFLSFILPPCSFNHFFLYSFLSFLLFHSSFSQKLNFLFIL